MTPRTVRAIDVAGGLLVTAIVVWTLLVSFDQLLVTTGALLSASWLGFGFGRYCERQISREAS